MSTIRERAAAALARAEAATPGPWSVDPISDVYVRHGEGGKRGPMIRALCPGDAPFIADARADVPDLATFALRVTGPEMREQILRIHVGGCFCENRQLHDRPCAHHAEEVDAIMALLTEGTDG